MRIETVILQNLIHSESYHKKVIPFIKTEYFTDSVERQMFGVIHSYSNQYSNPPSVTALEIEVAKLKFSQEEFNRAKNILTELAVPPTVANEWLVSETEKFCKDKALYNAIYSSIQIMNGDDKKLSTNAIPELLKEALSVSFDTAIGHDYLEQLKHRHDFYNRAEESIPFDIDILNKITGGGCPKKTLSIIAAPTGGGKSIFLCHHAAACLRQNKNVLYITLEMSEEKISERIDANMMNILITELRELPYAILEKKFKRVTEEIKGKLIVKEYPTGSASVLHFKHLMEELKLKKNFIPDVVIIDYLNICTSARYKASSGVNSYTMVKAIAEELRGLGVEHNVQVFSATQVNREGYDNTDIDLTNTSESMGTGFTADLLLAMISTEQLDQLNQVMFKQLKNRLNDVGYYRRFVVGLDKAKMKFYNLEDKAQIALHGSTRDREEKPGLTAPTVNPKADSFDQWE